MRVNVENLVGSGEIWLQLSQHAIMLNRVPSLRERLDEKIRDWNEQTSRLLVEEFPLQQHEQAFERWCYFSDQGKRTDAILKSAICDYLMLCRAVGQPENENHWRPLYQPQVARQGEMAKALQASFVSEQQLTRQWRKVLDKARAEWELQTIRDRRAALIAHLNDLLELFQELADAIEIFGFGPGVLFDLSDGALSSKDIDQFNRHSPSGLRNDVMLA